MEEGEKVGGCREKDSLYGNEIKVNKDRDLWACTMDTYINAEPGPGGADKNVESKYQTVSATLIRKTSSESMKAVKIHFFPN